jgi:cold shock CspA family protein
MSFKGKGKAKGKTDTKTQGHTLPRTRVSAEKFSGVVTAWKGKYGWIKPAEEIEHEKASLRNGSLFVSINDIFDVGELHPGAPCEFHIWEDETGLGAEEVVETGPPDPSAIPEDKGKGAKGGAKSPGKAAGKAPVSSNGWGGDKGYGDKGYGKAPSKAFSKGWSEPYGGKGKDAWGGGKDSWSYGGKGKDSWGAGKDSWGAGKDSYGKGKGPLQSAVSKGKSDKGKDGKGSGKRGKGHLLPRTRISAEKFQGTVSAWKGKYGWIKPVEEIEHEKAKAHKGGVFVSMDDLEGVTELTEGATVEFHIWEDSSGLGAEEVVQF